MIDQTIAHYHIKSKIGQGGMGIVYLATDTKLEREVAIKSLPPELAQDDAMRTRFIREAKLLAAMNHPGIATIHDVVDEQSNSYLIMEYIPGETLDERLARGAISFKETLAIACQIAQALVAAHEQRITHRDLKPANIKLLPDGRIKVLDFGLGKITAQQPSEQATLTQPGRIMGTTAYMSPEQARGIAVDERSDIWSFGCIVYEMLTGTLPFSGATNTDVLANILARDPDWQALPKELHAQGRRLLSKCLEKQPEKRFQSSPELYQAIQQYMASFNTSVLDVKVLEHSVRSPKVLACAGLIVVIAGLAIMGWVQRSHRIQGAMRDVPEILKLIEADHTLEAFQLAKHVEHVIPRNPTLKTLWPEMSKAFSVITHPPGAQIFFRDHRDVDGEHLSFGTSPITEQRIPYGVLRFEIRKPGYDTREQIVNTFRAGPRKLEVTLQETGQYAGMLRIKDCYIDKYEITNQAYKAFVDQGGYDTPEYWKQGFVGEDGREVTLSEAMDRFRDRTNRYGPATWEGGTFPEGQENYPVGGVSWFEAAAYCEFAGKTLPPLPCWNRGASRGNVQVVLPFSNFSGQLASIGHFKGITPQGLYDMAGNIREWCFNAPDKTNLKRYIMGGAYDDPGYVFTHRETRSPWDRDKANGFRCVQFPADQNAPPGRLFSPKQIAPWIRTEYPQDYQPKSEQEIRNFREDFAYDRMDLGTQLVWEDDSPRYWRKQKVTYAAAYNGETISAYLFLPKKRDPPYQPVLYFPGSGAYNQASSETLRGFETIDFVIKSGRALLYPVYKGHYERQFEGGAPKGQNRNAWRTWIQQLSKDVGRSIDYLAERGDMAMDRLAYYGFSWGSMQGPVFLAAEADRIQYAMLFVGGLIVDGAFHERVDPIHFLPHIEMPVLMINGTLDSIFPFETSAKPMYDLLGSQDKKMITFAGGHNPWGLVGAEVKGDILQWMDEHLGAVE